MMASDRGIGGSNPFRAERRVDTKSGELTILVTDDEVDIRDGAERILQLNVLTLREARDKLRHTGKAPATVNRHLGADLRRQGRNVRVGNIGI